MQQYWYYKGINKKGQSVYMLYAFKDGKKKYRQWIAPEGYSKIATERALNKAAVDFAAEVHAGKVLTKQELKEQAERESAELEKLLTVERYAKTVYMPKKLITIAENTRDSYERNLRLYVFPAIGKMRMEDVKPADISALLLDVQKGGKAHSSVIKVYNVLNNMFKEAFRDDTVSVNPMDKVERPKPTKAERIDKGVDAFTAEEIKHIKKLMEKEQLKWRTYTNLVIDTGCRNGEAVGLSWDGIDFKNNTVRLENNICYTQAKGIYIDTIKNGKARTNPISQETADLLHEMRREQQKNYIISPWVFTQDERGEVMHPQSPGRFLARFGKRNGIKNCRPHKFRHTAVSLMITGGVDVATVAEIVGDNVDTILRIYTHTNEEAKAKAFKKFQEILNGE